MKKNLVLLTIFVIASSATLASSRAGAEDLVDSNYCTFNRIHRVYNIFGTAKSIDQSIPRGHIAIKDGKLLAGTPGESSLAPRIVDTNTFSDLDSAITHDDLHFSTKFSFQNFSVVVPEDGYDIVTIYPPGYDASIRASDTIEYKLVGPGCSSMWNVGASPALHGGRTKAGAASRPQKTAKELVRETLLMAIVSGDLAAYPLATSEIRSRIQSAQRVEDAAFSSANPNPAAVVRTAK